MTDDRNPAALWCCPIASCRSALSVVGDALICAGPDHHRFVVEDGFPRFANIDVGKYNAEYAAKYAFLWSYGYETLGTGLVEGLYRTTVALAVEALADCDVAAPVIVDCGCGVGRVSADLGRIARTATILGLDASPFKLRLARDLVLGDKVIETSLPEVGFSQRLRIAGRGLRNVHLAQADAFAIPLASHAADVCVSQNLIDRLGYDPTASRTLLDFFTEVHRVLRPGGRLILLSPLNWLKSEEWARYLTANDIKRALEETGFSVTVCFDQLLYRELLDARGSVEEFNTAVLGAVAI